MSLRGVRIHVTSDSRQQQQFSGQTNMPIVHIALVEGRNEADVQRCVKAVARTVHETLGAPLDTIRVYATPVPATHWAVGDRTKAELSTTREALA